MRPLWALTVRSAMARPSPVPFGLQVKKGSKIWESCSFGMPQPVSRTVTRMQASPGAEDPFPARGPAGRKEASRQMEPAPSTASPALRRRLRKTSRSRIRSPRMTGRAGSRRDVNVTGPSAQEAAKERTSSSMKARKENADRRRERLWFRLDKSVSSACIYSTSWRMDCQYLSEVIFGCLVSRSWSVLYTRVRGLRISWLMDATDSSWADRSFSRSARFSAFSAIKCCSLS